MPFGSIIVKPGVNSVRTKTLNQAGISDSNLIRFRDGLVEKLGGWTRYINDAMGSVTRALLGWMDLVGIKRLAIGSLSSLKVATGSSTQDITPQSLTTNPALDFSTTLGSPIVTIVDGSISNLSQFDAVFFNTPISVGGIILTGLYQVNAGASGTSYGITAHTFATSTVANGGAVPTFTTAAGSTTITVTLANHGMTVLDKFNFPIATIVSGTTVSGTYSVVTVPTANTFTIIVTTAAIGVATVSMNSGAAQLLYYLGPATSSSRRVGGFLLDTIPLGYAAIGEGTIASITTSGTTGTAITTTDWSLVNWGEILIACPKGRPIFYWNPAIALPNAVCLGSGPAFANGIFLAVPQQILVAWGTSISMTNAGTVAAQDPLMLRWTNILDYTSWIPTSTNYAGSYRIPTGSEIRGGIQAANQALIFTDVDVYTMQYLGLPLVFGFQKIGDGCGLIGQHAVCSMQGNVYFMGDKQFYFIGPGGVRTIPCTVWDTVFQDLDEDNKSKCVAAPNSMFNEVFFFYPSTSGGTGECDKYVKFNADQMAWDIGTLSRSAWTDQTILGPPIGADPTTTYLQQHERGYDNDGSAITSYFETGYTVVGDGENFVFIDHVEPDMKWATINSTTNATVTMTMEAQKWPNDSGYMDDTLTLTSTTYYVAPRVRGRQVKVTLQSSDLGSWWRIGNTRYRWQADGRN